MTYQVTEENNISTVFLNGEIDMDVTDKAKDVILPLIEAGKEVHINLKDVEYMDSSGISVLIESHQKATELGTKVMNGKLTCSDRKSSGKVKDGTNEALNTEFKNPYSTASSAIVTTTLSACNASTEGQTSVSDDGSTVTITSCPANGEDLKTNTVTIE